MALGLVHHTLLVGAAAKRSYSQNTAMRSELPMGATDSYFDRASYGILVEKTATGYYQKMERQRLEQSVKALHEHAARNADVLALVQH